MKKDKTEFPPAPVPEVPMPASQLPPALSAVEALCPRSVEVEISIGKFVIRPLTIGQIIEITRQMEGTPLHIDTKNPEAMAFAFITAAGAKIPVALANMLELRPSNELTEKCYGLSLEEVSDIIAAWAKVTDFARLRQNFRPAAEKILKGLFPKKGIPPASTDSPSHSA